MTHTRPWNMIHSSATAALLTKAFAYGERELANGGGFTFRVLTRSGHEFEGCPTVTSANEVREVLAFEHGAFVLAHEIAAITVQPA